MKDPHVHAEKTLSGIGQAKIRDIIARITGLAGDLPATCGTWCGQRRPLSATSKIPEKVTCLACREAAAADHDRLAESGLVLLEHLEIPLEPAQVITIAAEAVRNRELAARYRA